MQHNVYLYLWRNDVVIVYFLSDLWHFEKLHAQLSLRQTSNAQAVATMATIVWATSESQWEQGLGNYIAPALTDNMSTVTIPGTLLYFLCIIKVVYSLII